MTTDYVYPKDTFIDCQDRPRSLSVRLFTSVGAMVALSWIPPEGRTSRTTASTTAPADTDMHDALHSAFALLNTSRAVGFQRFSS